MGAIITIGHRDDGTTVVHARSTYSKQLVYGPADWVTRIGSAGGEHSVATCRACYQYSLIKRWAEDPEVVARHAKADEAIAEAISHGRDAPAGGNGTTSVVADLDEILYLDNPTEFDALVDKQAERFLRIAQTCSDRRLQSLQREVRRHAAEALAQAKMPRLHPAQARACMRRYFTCVRAADIMFERMRKVPSS